MEKKYIDILRRDKLYDKKSIVFHEGVIDEIKDERDCAYLSEGRLGEFPMERVETVMGLPVIIPLTRESRIFKNAKNRIDLENQFQISTEKRVFCVLKIHFSELKMQLEPYQNEEDFILFKEKEGLQEFVGLIDSEKFGKMLGVVSFIKGKETIYIVKYAGIGNFTDIRMEQEIILNYIYKRVKK